MHTHTQFLRSLTLGILFAFSAIASNAVNAFDGYIEVTNDTGYDIYYLYISHEDSENWEEDVLEDDILENGDSVRVTVTGYDSAIFDVRAEDEDGDTYTVYGRNVKKSDLTLTLSHLDESSSSSAANSFDGYIEVENNTGYDVYYLYISHEDSENWEEDVLEDDILEDGDSVRVTVTGYASAVFDVRAKDEDGDTYTIYGIDVEKNDLSLTLSHLDD